MSTLIQIEKLDNHTVSKYDFKSLTGINEEFEEVGFSSLVEASNNHDNSEETLENIESESYTEDENPNRRVSDVDASSMSKGSKDALIESLMKKTDEMSSNFIKLQMKLEDKEIEYAKSLETAKTSSYTEGLDAGTKQATEDIQNDLKEGITQLGNSIKTLENSAKEFESALEVIKADLMTAAIDIAQEVINVEIDTKSSEIASVLSDALIKDLQSASKITLKVNPKDHGSISEHVGSLENIQILSDSAISEGGVIAISDVGNIDSQISKRFQRVKRAALSE